MSPVSAPADKRFRRIHVKPGRKRSWRGLVWPALKCVAMVLFAGYAAYRGSAMLAHAPMLQVDDIAVRGVTRLTEGEVRDVLGDLRGDNIVWTDLDAWRGRLLASPWIRDASLRRSLPSTVEVTVFERTPICIGRINGSLYLVDERGVVIDEYGPQYADIDLPIVDGLGTAPGVAGSLADQPRAELAAQLIASLAADPAVAGRLSQVDVSNLDNAVVILSGDPAVIHVGHERFLPRLRSYVQLAPALRERVPDIDYVDLRFDDRIYVRPAGGRRAVEVASR